MCGWMGAVIVGHAHAVHLLAHCGTISPLIMTLFPAARLDAFYIGKVPNSKVQVVP